MIVYEFYETDWDHYQSFGLYKTKEAAEKAKLRKERKIINFDDFDDLDRLYFPKTFEKYKNTKYSVDWSNLFPRNLEIKYKNNGDLHITERVILG